MMKKKRMISVLSGALAAVLLLVGCGGQAAQTAVPADSANTMAATQPGGSYLTGQEAEAIALSHAGLTADQVTRMHTEFDKDYGVAEYDVEFLHDGWEYEYEINAETGEILSWDKEPEK